MCSRVWRYALVPSVLVISLGASARAATLTLATGDALGYSSFSTGTNWSNAQAPSAGNDYVVGIAQLRTPADAASHVFAGDSLEITTNGILMYKGTSATAPYAVLTMNNLILSGGLVRHANASSHHCVIAGNINVTADSTLYPNQGPIDISAPISGNANLTVNGSYTLSLLADNPFTGNFNVSGRLRLAGTGGLRFVIGAIGVNNAISGAGTGVFEGAFDFDLTGASANLGDSWTIVSVSARSFAGTFSVTGFTDNGDGTWSTTANGVTYVFDEATGTLSVPAPTHSSPFTVSKFREVLIDSRALTLDSTVASYGIGINGTSFENSAITTYGGWQYAAYWVKDGTTYHVAVARREIDATAWQVADLTDSLLVNGLSGGKPADAHNVVSLGIDEIDGTIHLAYDMHGHTLKYRVSNTGVASDPGSITEAQWTQALFQTQRNWLVSSGSTITGVTYPHFIRRSNGDLQFTYRTGSSGNGSNWLADYSGTTHAWSNVHQYDDGTVGTYTGTVTVNGTNRNSYINGATYGPTGRLHQTFTWREAATGAANHDINYVYSDDNGNTWMNNAGTVVGSTAAGTRFNLTSPGLIVVPLSESMSLMNQQAQAVTSNDTAHALMWHRDTAKTDATNGTWDPGESSYFNYWRDGLGNWHRNKLPGVVGQRPKLFFDATDNAIAIYQAGTFSSSGIYINNGELVVAAATKATNWTDWKIVATETGPFVSEAQADARLFALNGTFCVVMQESPSLTTPAQATSIRSLDYSIALTSPTPTLFTADSGDWDVPGNWSGGVVPAGNADAYITGGRTARIDTTLSLLDGNVMVGSGSGTGTLSLVDGAAISVGGSIVVGRDSGAVGNYSQTGGTASAWRFVVGDFYNETTGGGASTATVSGGTLSTGEVQVGVSANASSSGSSLVVGGTGNVTVNGEVIVGDNGNTASVVLSGGTLTVAGDLREGLNKTNSSTLRFDGGTLDMTGNAITVDALVVDSGRLMNASSLSLGMLVMEISGPPAGGDAQLTLSGTAMLGGTLQITLLNGYTLQPGVVYTLIAGPVSGEFATVNGLPAGWHVQHEAGAVTLVSLPPIPADFDGDFDVDAREVDIFKACATGSGILYDPSNLPSSCQVSANGSIIAPDFDGDGDVDGDDFGVLQRCYSGGNNLASPTCVQ